MPGPIQIGVARLTYDKMSATDPSPWLLDIAGLAELHENANDGVWVGDRDLRHIRTAITKALDDGAKVVTLEQLIAAYTHMSHGNWGHPVSCAGCREEAGRLWQHLTAPEVQ